MLLVWEPNNILQETRQEGTERCGTQSVFEPYSLVNNTYLHIACDALDVGAEVKPQREQTRQGLKNVAVAVLNSQAIVANDLRQDLKVRLVLSQWNPVEEACNGGLHML